VKLPAWLTPFRKQTDLNTVTPIGAALHMPSNFGWIVEAFAGAWQGGMVLKSTQNLLAFSAVYACINLLAADISKLRLMLMRMNDGIWQEVTDPHSPFLSVLRKPNRFQTRIQFLAYWVASKLIYGNAYILLERDARGVVRAMYPLDPRGVKPLVAGDGSVYYQMTRDALAGINEEANITVPASEIIHDRMVTLWHPLVGVSPLYACGASATQGIRIQENSAKFFENMSRPSGQLTAPGKIDDVTAERLKREFESGFAGNNIGRIFVSGGDLKFQPFTIPAEQAQLIEQQRWTVEDVARAFGVPLYKVQAGNNPTFSNVGALNQEYYGQCLQTHIESIELLIDEALGLPANGMGVELDLEGLLRMDPVSRAEVADKKVKAGVLKPNEARRLDNLPPVTGGDQCYLQQQNFSLAALAKRDAREDPFGSAKPSAPPAPPPDDDDDVDDDEAEEIRSTVRRVFA
jgi:HK97 family phage portal protein